MALGGTSPPSPHMLMDMVFPLSLQRPPSALFLSPWGSLEGGKGALGTVGFLPHIAELVSYHHPLTPFPVPTATSFTSINCNSVITAPALMNRVPTVDMVPDTSVHFLI